MNFWTDILAFYWQFASFITGLSFSMKIYGDQRKYGNPCCSLVFNTKPLAINKYHRNNVIWTAPPTHALSPPVLSVRLQEVHEGRPRAGPRVRQFAHTSHECDTIRSHQEVPGWDSSFPGPLHGTGHLTAGTQYSFYRVSTCHSVSCLELSLFWHATRICWFDCQLHVSKQASSLIIYGARQSKLPQMAVLVLRNIYIISY